MLSINVIDCKDCGSISQTLNLLDAKIASLSKDQYNSYTYLSAPTSKNKLGKLVIYRDILINLYWNSSYYDYNYQEILSKIKHIINVR